MPNAIEPTDAEINIAKFNKSAITLAFARCPGACNIHVSPAWPSEILAGPAQKNASAILAEEPAR
jgi:hypothetical protein